MIIFPAIDLLDGKCVRLKQGAEQTAKIYHDDPAEMAARWQNLGAEFIHVVNLDGAFGRAKKNADAIRAILHAVQIPIQLGGGIRSVDDAERWLRTGVERVIFGTAAVKAPEDVYESIARFGAKKIVVGIDARSDKVAIEGWENQTDIDIFAFAEKMKANGVERIVYTDVRRDGELSGPNVDRTIELAEQTQLHVIASGGFSAIDHVLDLAGRKSAFIEGAIIGTALYEGKIDLSELIER